MISRSRNVSLRRRALPASETSTAAGCSRRTETTASNAARPSPSRRRSDGSCFFSASAFRTRSSVFAPRPVSVRSCSFSAARLSSSTVVTPSSRQMRAAVFGPSPGRRMKSTTSGGTIPLRFVNACISPSLTTWTIFSSIVLPIPFSSLARPASASSATLPAVSRIRVAARRYASTRNDASPSSSRRSASRSSWSATSLFRGRALATSRSYGWRDGRPGRVLPYAWMQATVCLPTYNERENIEPMLRALVARDVRVLVIDDNSPDGTGEIADRLGRELGNLDVLHRERKEGLGPAYLAGFRRALADGAELVLEMDCDFSHSPDDVPRLIAAAEDADLVIGSRYVAGGSIGNWGVVRRFVSTGGSLYARALLGVGVRDLTGGFKCYRRRVLEAIESKGYAFQIETTYRTLRAGFRVEEIPIHFVDREEGGSKMSRAIVAEAVWKVPALRLAALLGRL